MNVNNLDNAPPLAAPGAGLPWPELVVARLLFGIKRRIMSQTGFHATFEGEKRRIEELLRTCPVELRDRRVLIRRLPGLEDSSRFWSVWMTLDHLRITNEAFAMVIRSLAAGNIPPGRASTADVKPRATVDDEVEAAYRKSLHDLARCIAAVEHWAPEPKFAHPWFGPLDSAGWRTLSATHLGIHRRQMERIIAGLGQAC